MSGIFEVDVSVITKSQRVAGMAAQALRSRSAVRQRAPLTVAMMEKLEQAVLDDGGRGTEKSLIAGTVLFAVYGRLRIGDIRKWHRACP